jgi:RNA-binding protein PNO1
MNTKKQIIELRTSEYTKEENALQKAVDFIDAFLIGFEVKDAISIMRLDEIYIETFEIKDGKLYYLTKKLKIYKVNIYHVR